MPIAILSPEEENDRAFITALYEQYGRLMLAEIRKLVSDRWDADDVFQTTLEKLIAHVDTLRDMEPKRLVSYVATAARPNAIRPAAWRSFGPSWGRRPDTCWRPGISWACPPRRSPTVCSSGRTPSRSSCPGPESRPAPFYPARKRSEPGRAPLPGQASSSGCWPSWAGHLHSDSSMWVNTALKDESSGLQA